MWNFIETQSMLEAVQKWLQNTKVVAAASDGGSALRPNLDVAALSASSSTFTWFGFQYGLIMSM